MKIRFDFDVMSDEELMEWFYIAQELRDMKYLKRIKKELNMRWCNA